MGPYWSQIVFNELIGSIGCKLGNKFGKDRYKFFIKLTLFDIYTYFICIYSWGCMHGHYLSICAYLSVFCHHQSWHEFSLISHHVISIHSCHPRVIQQRNTILFCFGCRIEWKSKFAKRRYNNQIKSKPKKLCNCVPNCGMSQNTQKLNSTKIWLLKCFLPVFYDYIFFYLKKPI